MSGDREPGLRPTLDRNVFPAQDFQGRWLGHWEGDVWLCPTVEREPANATLMAHPVDAHLRIVLLDGPDNLLDPETTSAHLDLPNGLDVSS